MNENAFGAPALGTALTEQEMAETVGGESLLWYVGFAVGMFAAMVVQTATSPEMQQYCFGA